MNSSPVMVSFSYRKAASSSSLARLSVRSFSAFSCCCFTSATTCWSIFAWVSAEQARDVSPPRYWFCTVSMATMSKSLLMP